MRDIIEFRVPLPPVTLRANSSAGRWQRTVDANAYSQEVYGAWLEWCQLDGFYMHDGPWPRARVTYTWCYCGTAPDESNLGGNTKMLQDILCVAPAIGLRTTNRTYLGIIDNDRGVIPVYLLQRVDHRADEGVDIRIERLA